MSIGFDCDCPRIHYGTSDDQIALLDSTLRTLDGIAALLGPAGVARTVFLNGAFLELVRHVGEADRLRRLISDELVEIGDHGFSHRPYRRLANRSDYRALNVSELDLELSLTGRLLRWFSDRTVVGVRTPLGFPRGLHGREDLLSTLSRHGIAYVSADLRDSDLSPHGTLGSDGTAIRQPYSYANGIVEVPGHGHHDSVFERAVRGGEVPESVRERARAHYADLLATALELARSSPVTVHVGLVLHPSSISWYDPGLSVLADLVAIADAAGPGRIRFQSYREVADGVGRDSRGVS